MLISKNKLIFFLTMYTLAPSAYAGIEDDMRRMRDEIQYLKNELSTQISLLSEMQRNLREQAHHVQVCASKAAQLENNVGNINTQIYRQNQAINDLIKFVTPVPARGF